jgi:hypothetical protein
MPRVGAGPWLFLALHAAARVRPQLSRIPTALSLSRYVARPPRPVCSDLSAATANGDSVRQKNRRCSDESGSARAIKDRRVTPNLGHRATPGRGHFPIPAPKQSCHNGLPVRRATAIPRGKYINDARAAAIPSMSERLKATGPLRSEASKQRRDEAAFRAPWRRCGQSRQQPRSLQRRGRR